MIFENTSETAPFVEAVRKDLRHFGLKTNPDDPAMGAYRKNKSH